MVGQYINFKFATEDPFVTYTVPDGIYEYNDVSFQIYLGSGLTVTYDDKTGKYSFSDPQVFPGNKYKAWLQLSPDLAKFCGVDTAPFMVSSHNPPINGYTAPRVALVTLTKSIYVNCHMNACDNWDAIKSGFKESRTIARAGIDNINLRNPISVEFQSPVYSDLSDRVISSISLSLSSEQFTIITPNLDWSITLSIIECLKPLMDDEESALGTVDALTMEDLKLEDSDLSGFTDLDAQDALFTDAARKLKSKRKGVK